MLTLRVPSIFSGGFLMVQAKSSFAEALRRSLADDPIWHQPDVRVVNVKRWPNKHFKRGIAFRFFPNT